MDPTGVGALRQGGRCPSWVTKGTKRNPDMSRLPASVLAVVEREADVVNHDDRMVIIL